MTESGSELQKSFGLQQQTTDTSWQPLEVYHLSHDLRGPLNSILGFAELLLEGIEGPLNEHQEADIAAIYQSAQNLLRLISNVVDLSKLEANRLNFEFQTVDLSQIIQNIVTFDFGTNKPEQVELVAKVPDTLPPLWGDHHRIEQMIMSLVRFGFQRKKTGQVTITAKSDGQETTVQVGIEGLTLPAEQVAELFELIVHVDAAGRSHLGQGGLELPLTQRLAEKHNGRVWVESDGDTGTIFYLRLPVHNVTNES